MPKQAKASSAKSKTAVRDAGTSEQLEGGKHRPKNKTSKNDDRARRR